MTMMLFYYVRGVSACLRKKPRCDVNCGGEHIDPYGIVGGPYHRSPAFAEIIGDLLPDIIPACRPDDGSLEIFRNELVVGPEGLRNSEVHAYAFTCKFLVHRGDVLAPAGTLDTALPEDALYHLSHTAVAAYKYLHIVFTSKC